MLAGPLETGGFQTDMKRIAISCLLFFSTKVLWQNAKAISMKILSFAEKRIC